MDIKKTFVYFLFFGIIFSFFYGFLSGENSAGAGGYNGDLSWIIKNIEIFKNHSIVDAIKHPDIYGNRAKWIAKFIEFNIEVKPTKLVKRQDLAKLMAEENCNLLDINCMGSNSDGEWTKEATEAC